MKNTSPKKFRILKVVTIIIVIGLVSYGSIKLGQSLISFFSPCNGDHWVPEGSVNRFIYLVISGYADNNIELLEMVVSEDVIDLFDDLPEIEPDSITVNTYDILKGYDYRVYFNNGECFDIMLIYDRWPSECPATSITDDQILEHFYLESLRFRDSGTCRR